MYVRFVLFIACLYICVCECLLSNNNHKTDKKDLVTGHKVSVNRTEVLLELKTLALAHRKASFLILSSLPMLLWYDRICLSARTSWFLVFGLLYLHTPSNSIQFSSILIYFLSTIGARTLKMPVPYPPPSVRANTWTPSHQPLLFGCEDLDHLP